MSRMKEASRFPLGSHIRLRVPASVRGHRLGMAPWSEYFIDNGLSTRATVILPSSSIII